MSGVRVLVGTRKGAFVLTSDGKRETVGRQRPALRGLGDLPRQGLAGRPEPALRVAVQRLVRAGDPALRRRRQDVGAGRQQVRLRRRARHAPVVRRHAAPLGVQARLAPRAVADRSGHGLRRRRGRRAVPLDRRRADAGRSCPGCASHGSGPRWQPGAGGMCLHTILLDPEQSASGSSSPSRPRARSAPTTAARPGSRSTAACSREDIPDPNAEVGHCVHRIAMHPSRPDVLFMQKHWDVMRSDDAGDSWHEVSGNLPTDFGFPIDVHAHEPETIYVVPIKSDSRALPARRQAARLPQPHRRQRVGAAHQGPAAERLLRQRAARRDGRRLARLVRRLLRHHRRPGLRVGRRRRHLGADRPRPAGGAVGRGADAAMIRVVLPAHLRTLAQRRRRGAARGRRAGHRSASVLDALEAALPDAARHDPRPRHAASAGRSCGSSPARRTCPTSRRTPRCPTRSRPGREPFLIVGAMAGG